MPKVTVGTTPTPIYQSKHGVFGGPSRLEMRIDPEAADTSSVWYAQRADVTVGGTDDNTDGIPLLFGETRSDPDILNTETTLYAVASADTAVYFEVFGPK